MVSPLFPSQFSLSLLRQQVDRIVQRYPDVVSVQSGVQDRMFHFQDWRRLRAVTGESRGSLSSLWNTLRRPEEAQKELARAHLEILFTDPVFRLNIFRDPINGFAGYAEDKAGILRMIGERGFEGYIGFLISVMNQQWSQVWVVENFRLQKGLPLDDEEAEMHCESARTILQLLSLISESQLVRRHFRDGWIAKVAHGHDLEVVQSTVSAALRR